MQIRNSTLTHGKPTPSPLGNLHFAPKSTFEASSVPRPVTIACDRNSRPKCIRQPVPPVRASRRIHRLQPFIAKPIHHRQPKSQQRHPPIQATSPHRSKPQGSQKTKNKEMGELIEIRDFRAIRRYSRQKRLPYQNSDQTKHRPITTQPGARQERFFHIAFHCPSPITKKTAWGAVQKSLNGRAIEIRTRDLLSPRQARYQTAP